MFYTRVCELLNIKYPILQGGMAYAATAELVSAVSNAGAFGIIGTGMMTPAEVENEIKKTKELTDKPFGVNILLLNPNINDVIDVIIKEKVTAVTTGAGNPAVYIPKLKEANIKVIPVVSSVALAKRLTRYNIDAIIAEGEEAGGHIGDVSTLCLIPQVVDAVNIPVIAAGGIADARGFIAAFVLGAQGVQMGTRFLCSTECVIHNNYKQKIIVAHDRATTVTGRSIGHPVRCIRNKLTHKFEELEREGAKKEEIEALGIGKLKAAVYSGDIEYGSLMAGQVSGLIKEIKPAAEIIEEIIKDAEKIITKISYTPPCIR